MTALPSSRPPRPTRPTLSAEVVAAAAALGVHGALLAILAGREPGRTLARDEPPLELSVSLDEPLATVTPHQDDTRGDRAGGRDNVQAPDRARLAAAARQSRDAEPSTHAVTPEPALSSEAPWIPSWSLPAAGDRRIDLGLDGGIAWRPSLRPDRAVDPRFEDGAETADPGGLRSALDEGDRALGLGVGGPVVAAVHEASRAVSAVHDGAATIEVTADATGRVLAVRVFDVSSDEAAWTETAGAIGAALQGRRIGVPSGARGVVVSVRIDVAIRLPSGRPVGHAVTPVGNADGIGGGFDVSDIGARPRSVVHARVIAQRRL